VKPRNQPAISLHSAIILLVITAGAWLFVGMIRMMRYGLSWRELWLTLLFLAPLILFTFVVLQGLGWKRAAVGAVLWASLVLGTVEAYAQAQEILFRHRTRNLPASAGPVYEARWWPFGSSGLSYNPKDGSWWGND
jgi:hypothetical protein